MSSSSEAFLSAATRQLLIDQCHRVQRYGAPEVLALPATPSGMLASSTIAALLQIIRRAGVHIAIAPNGGDVVTILPSLPLTSEAATAALREARDMLLQPSHKVMSSSSGSLKAEPRNTSTRLAPFFGSAEAPPQDEVSSSPRGGRRELKSSHSDGNAPGRRQHLPSEEVEQPVGMSPPPVMPPCLDFVCRWIIQFALASAVQGPFTSSRGGGSFERPTLTTTASSCLLLPRVLPDPSCPPLEHRKGGGEASAADLADTWSLALASSLRHECDSSSIETHSLSEYLALDPRLATSAHPPAAASHLGDVALHIRHRVVCQIQALLPQRLSMLMQLCQLCAALVNASGSEAETRALHATNPCMQEPELRSVVERSVTIVGVLVDRIGHAARHKVMLAAAEAIDAASVVRNGRRKRQRNHQREAEAEEEDLHEDDDAEQAEAKHDDAADGGMTPRRHTSPANNSHSSPTSSSSSSSSACSEPAGAGLTVPGGTESDDDDGEGHRIGNDAEDDFENVAAQLGQDIPDDGAALAGKEIVDSVVSASPGASNVATNSDVYYLEARDFEVVSYSGTFFDDDGASAVKPQPYISKRSTEGPSGSPHSATSVLLGTGGRRPVAIFIQGAIGRHVREAAADVLRPAATENNLRSKTNGNNGPPLTGIVGYYDYLNNPTNHKCRLTKFSRDNWPSFSAPVEQLLTQLDSTYRTWAPDAYLRQSAAIPRNYRFMDTVFSTLTVNDTFRTAAHVDRGDFKLGYGAVSVLNGTYSGCHLAIKKLKKAFHLRPGDVLLFDTSYEHGNTEPTMEDWSRLSIVAYLRTGLTTQTCELETMKRQLNLKAFRSQIRHMLKDGASASKDGSAAFHKLVNFHDWTGAAAVDDSDTATADATDEAAWRGRTKGALPPAMLPIAAVVKLTSAQTAALSFVFRHLAQRTGAIVAMSMGLGKTFVALCIVYTFLRDERYAGEDIIVVAPKTIMGHWAAQARKWAAEVGLVIPNLVVLTDHDGRDAQLNQAEALKQYGMTLAETEGDVTTAGGGTMRRGRSNAQRRPSSMRHYGDIIVGQTRGLQSSSRLVAPSAAPRQHGRSIPPTAAGSAKGIGRVIVVNPESLHHILQRHRIEPCLVIADEGHRLASRDTKLSDLMRTIATTNRVVLTGTPMQNAALELYDLAEWAEGPGRVPAIPRDAFQRWLAPIERYVARGDDVSAAVVAQTFVSEWLKCNVFRATDSSLPPLRDFIVTCELAPFQAWLLERIFPCQYAAALGARRSTPPSASGPPSTAASPEKEDALAHIACPTDLKRACSGQPPTATIASLRLSASENRHTHVLLHPLAYFLLEGGRVERNAPPRREPLTTGDASRGDEDDVEGGGDNDDEERQGSASALDDRESSEGCESISGDAAASSKSSVESDAEAIKRTAAASQPSTLDEIAAAYMAPTFGVVPAKTEPNTSWCNTVKAMLSDSGKLTALLTIVLAAHEKGEKVVVFSQFMATMAIATQFLEIFGVNVFRLSGDDPAEVRAATVRRFESWRPVTPDYRPGDHHDTPDDSRWTDRQSSRGQCHASDGHPQRTRNATSASRRCRPVCLLLSLKVGAYGIELPSASVVVFLDSWWNPQVDQQAIARCYRHRQTRAVSVFRLCAADSPEESQVLAAQLRKLALFKYVVDGLPTHVSPSSAIPRVTRESLGAVGDSANAAATSTTADYIVRELLCHATLSESPGAMEIMRRWSPPKTEGGESCGPNNRTMTTVNPTMRSAETFAVRAVLLFSDGIVDGSRGAVKGA